jgi:hypothetical protein
MEADLLGDDDVEKLRSHWQTLQIMESELDDLHNVPLAYMQEFYSLRLHIEFVERRVIRRLRLNNATLQEFESENSDSGDTQPQDNANPNDPILSTTEETISIDSTVSFDSSHATATAIEPDSRNDGSPKDST